MRLSVQVIEKNLYWRLHSAKVRIRKPMTRPFVPIRPIILCIEDNKNYLELRKALLEKNGYTVIAATEPDAALEHLRNAPVCLVISDHMLRGSTGVDLAARMKKVKPTVPIVLYSGRVPETLRNVDCFINKDESRTHFLKVISELIRRYCDNL